MVLDSGRIKVMDFGIAKVVQAISSSTTHSVGTLQYMSPEQIDAAPVDARSDLYSLGLILYEMLAGRPPFESPSPRELLDLQCTATPPTLPDEVRASMPRGVEKVLLQLLAKAPDERLASAEALLLALEPFGTADDTIPMDTPVTASKRDASATAPDDESGPEQATENASARPGSAADGTAGDTSGQTMATGRPVAGPLDTVGLIESAERPREIATGTAIIALSSSSALWPAWSPIYGA